MALALGQSTHPDENGFETSSVRQDSATAVVLNADTKIRMLYLTFETKLPTANVLHSSTPTQPNTTLPCQPDLTPFIDPHLWPDRRKNTLLTLSCIATFLTAYTAGSYSPPIPIMVRALHAPSNLVVTVGITTFCLGFALAPMVLAPFSEINGRYPVFVVAGILYVLFQAICGLVPDVAGMVVARFIVGVGASVFSTMVGGVIADLWHKEGRNTPLAIFSGAVLVGTGAGPLVASVIAERLADGDVGSLSAPWRWVFWHQVIIGSVLMLALVVLFKESRGSVLLSRKAKTLNGWYEELETAGYYGVWMEVAAAVDEDEELPATPSDEEKSVDAAQHARQSSTASTAQLQRIRWLVKEDEERTSIAKMISISVSRPFHLLVTEPVVFFFSLWVSFAWGILYLTFGSVPLVFARQYGWGVEQSGRVFIAMIAGSLLSTPIGIWQDRILQNPRWQPDEVMPVEDESGSPKRRQRAGFWNFLRTHFPATAPESRLYFTCLTATLLPIGLYLFGFASRPSVSPAAPAAAVGLATMGIYAVYLATFNYLADTYHKYASSALAAQSCCRNLLGGVFPLVVGSLIPNLGEARAGGLLGGIATALTVVPFVLVFFGERIRRRSRIASVSYLPLKAMFLFHDVATDTTQELEGG
jgi:MFS family permease